MSEPFDLFDRFPEMQPITRAPSLHTVNGIGTMAYGRRDYDPETGTYVKTVWFTLIYIPILPLGAYRVVDMGGGWGFVGKVPLSGMAKGWPVLLLLLISCGVGVGMWVHHTGTPEYAASQKLAQADGLRAAGKLGEAARLYRDVAESGTDRVPRAMHAIADMLSEESLAASGDSSEAADVFRVGWDVRQRPDAIGDLFARGLRFAEARATDNPATSLAVLEAIEPAAPDPKAALPARTKVLERLTKDRPDDVELLAKLAVTYERSGQRDRCLALLEPHAQRLGATEGARILGLIYYEKGKNDEAFTLLQTYADQRLEAVSNAERMLDSAFRGAESAAVDRLKTGKAPGFDYARYKSAGRTQQDAQVEEYISKQVRDNADLQRRREEFIQLGVVVPVALDLGMMRLERAQRIADAAERKAELERAEKTFLAVRGLAGDRAEYRLSLGQVYYWLGKQDEGRKLFDEALKADNRRFETLMLVATLLRQLGAMDEARTLAEEAYNQDGADARKREQAALLRAMSRKDTDDAITWLERANPANPEVKAFLAESRGHKAMAEGKEAEAADFYRQAIAVYAAEAESAATLNNAAISYLALYRAIGDKGALERALHMQEKATALKPGDGIVVGNVASQILSSAVGEIAGDRIDFAALRRQPDLGDLGYLYADPAGRDALVKRARANATITRGRATYDRALILAPKNAGLYAQYAGLLYFLGETPALEGLDRRAAAAKLDLSEGRQDRLDFWQGKRDDKFRTETTASVARAERAVVAGRKAGGLTFAVSVGILLRARLGQEPLGLPFDADELVRLTEEAERAAPSVATTNNLRTALLIRASRALAAAEPAYATMVKRAGRPLGSSYLIAAALWRDGPARKAALANADVQRAVELTRASAARFPSDPDEWTWVMLRSTHAEDAARVAAALKSNELLSRKRGLDGQFDVGGDPVTALRQCWRLEATGTPGDSREILRRCAGEGGPLPFDVP